MNNLFERGTSEPLGRQKVPRVYLSRLLWEAREQEIYGRPLAAAEIDAVAGTGGFDSEGGELLLFDLLGFGVIYGRYESITEVEQEQFIHENHLNDERQGSELKEKENEFPATPVFIAFFHLPCWTA
ncbi:hypothetical protein M0R45_038133 [Rubus argutus]|uniref:Uncharacterized protein n=1 Tax=Rubus argutus TaxID=59490 RepID=A0AAW1W1D9_RUBAR